MPTTSNIHKISQNLEKNPISGKHSSRRPWQHPRRAATAPARPDATRGHRLASASPPEAASAPYDAPNDVNLAPARLHRSKCASGARKAASRRHRWPPRAPRAPDARRPRRWQRSSPCRPPMHACGGRHGSFGPHAGPTAAATVGAVGTRQRHRDDTANCPIAANESK